MMDEIIDPEVTVRIIGNQWYWSYEFGAQGWIDQANRGLINYWIKYLIDLVMQGPIGIDLGWSYGCKSYKAIANVPIG